MTIQIDESDPFVSSGSPIDAAVNAPFDDPAEKPDDNWPTITIGSEVVEITGPDALNRATDFARNEAAYRRAGITAQQFVTTPDVVIH